MVHYNKKSHKHHHRSSIVSSHHETGKNISFVNCTYKRKMALIFI